MLRTAARRAADTVTDAACGVTGRGNVVRAARHVLRRASRDVRNDMKSNGELSLQNWTLAAFPGEHDLTVIDGGANVGSWSAAMLDAAGRSGRPGRVRLHAFEPASFTFARLTEALAGRDGVTLRQEALSDASGTSLLQVLGPGAGVNSLYQRPGHAAARIEAITTTTLDEYAAAAGLAAITLLKVDTEGHDLAVLRGAGQLITERRIAVIQFEYNWRWVQARAFLSDAFALLGPAGYQVGKLTPRGIEAYPAWDPELETFIEGNYAAVLPELAARLPSVRWWKLK